MPSIPDVVGSHDVRFNPQLSAGASVNMFAEYGDRPAPDQPRPPRWQLPVHGYGDSVSTRGRQRVTAMVSTKERRERLLAAHGRTLGIHGGDSLQFSGLPAGWNRSPLVLGAARVGTVNYWVRDDGTVMRLEDGRDSYVPVLTKDAAGVHVVGMAVTSNVAADNIEYAWFTCLEDRRIRCWRIDLSVSSGGGLVRTRSHDLDVSETALNVPESLWIDPPTGTPGDRTITMLVLDAIGGRVVEFQFDEASTTWRRSTPLGDANPYDFQRVSGNALTQEPLVVGGIFAGPEDIRVANRATGKQMVFDRQTGIHFVDVDLPDFSDGETIRVEGKDETAPKVACGCVSGGSSRIWYVNGLQYQATRVTSEGRPIDEYRGKFFTDGGRFGTNYFPDVEDPNPKPSMLEPLGDGGRFVGWALDRRLHVIDLKSNRVIQNVEGGIDTLTNDSGRLLATDASLGWVKASPVNLVRLPSEIRLRYGSVVATAGFRIPGFPRDAPRTVTGLYVGVRSVLVRTDDNSLWLYRREDLSAVPVKLSGSATVIGVCVSRDHTAVIEGSGNNGIRVKRFRKTPETVAEYGSPDETHEIVLEFERFNVRAFAADATRLFIVHRTASQPIRQLGVYTMADGQKVAGLSADNFRYDSASLFGDLTINAGSTAAPNHDWLRGITWVTGTGGADNYLLAAVRQAAPFPTVVRAFKSDGGVWSRAAGLDLNDDISTNVVALAHDAHLVFDLVEGLEDDSLAGGESVKSTGVNAFVGSRDDRVSKYSWAADRQEPTGATAAVAVRGNVYAFSSSGMEIRVLVPGGRGFPYSLEARRTMGIVAPLSMKVVRDRLFWLGVSSGGGVRVWVIGTEGDTTPAPVEGKSIEEMLGRISGVPAARIEDAVAYADDIGGHPTYCLHISGAGVTLCYDLDSEMWHVRTSARANVGVADPEVDWEWLQDAPSQGVHRVTHSATWNNRLYCGGFDAAGAGVIKAASLEDWRDIDGGDVLRRRQFGGLTVNVERRDVKTPSLRVDVAYGDASPGDTHSLWTSDDGGKTFSRFGARPLGGAGSTAPRPFYLLSHSKDRVYRVDCVAPVPFSIRGAYLADNVQVARKL